MNRGNFDRFGDKQRSRKRADAPDTALAVHGQRHLVDDKWQGRAFFEMKLKLASAQTSDVA